MVLFPLPVIAAITLGIVGAVIESLSYLLIIGVVLLLAGLVLLGTPAQQKAPAPWLVRPRSEFLLVTPSPRGPDSKGPGVRLHAPPPGQFPGAASLGCAARAPRSW